MVSVESCIFSSPIKCELCNSRKDLNDVIIPEDGGGYVHRVLCDACKESLRG
jgi:hypothetical protein